MCIRDRKYAEVWRHSWETITNRYLEAAGRPERVDLRSFERQGIQQIQMCIRDSRYPRHDGGDAAGVLPWDVREKRSAHGKAAVVLLSLIHISKTTRSKFWTMIR